MATNEATEKTKDISDVEINVTPDMFKSKYAALGWVQATLKAPKCLRNEFGKYNYRSAETILESVKPLLKAVGALVLLSDKIVRIEDRYYVEATATFVHIATGDVESVTASAREEECKKGMDGSQVTGASSSYARKYALNGLFAIDDGVDSDSTNDKKPELISEEQIKEFNELGVRVDNVLKRFKVTDVHELTKEQAIFVINSKKKALKEE